MLLEEEELKRRIESPSNLLNRLRLAKLAMPSKPVSLPASLPIIDIVKQSPSVHPALPPTSDDVVEDLNSKITIGSIKGKAMGIMSSALDELKAKLPEVGKPDKLSKIVADMSKVYDAVENRNATQAQAAQIIIYAPQIVSEEHFNVVDLGD
jgi:hypothetical protein